MPSPPERMNQAIASGTLPLGRIHSAYLHIPFCFHKCHYCDFYSIVDSRDRQAAFVDRLIAEIQAASPILNPPLRTMFIGGGTPTLLAPTLWNHLLAALQEYLPLENQGEFTVEANPETVTDELAVILKQGGINRISIGCQSFNPIHLKTLERWHDPANVMRSVVMLRNAGISNINLDLIFAIPGQSLDDWLCDLDQVIALEPAHISCYGLVYEPNTALTVKMKQGAITPADQELEAVMYRATRERLSAAGYEHYEISNWSRSIQNPKSKSNIRRGGIQDSLQCRHNLTYWRNENWWAFGPSASGHVNGVRWKNIARLGEYLEHEPWPSITDFERVDDDARIGEQFMLGLRLIEGMPLEMVDALLSIGKRADDRRRAIARHTQAGLLHTVGHRLQLTDDGLLLADAVLADLV